MADNQFKQLLSPLDSLSQQATRLQSGTNQIFEGLTSELVGAGNALMNSARSAVSTVTGFVSGADTVFSNFITRITPNDLLNKRSGLESLLPAGKIIAINKSSLIGSDTMQIPLNPSDAKYKMRLSFREYVRPSALSSPKIERKNAIVLPIPAELFDGHDISWDPNATGLMGALVNTFGGDNFEDAQKGIRQALNNGSTSEFMSAVKNQWDTVNNATSEDAVGGVKVGATQIAKRYVAKRLSPELYDLSTQITGDTLNPHPTVLFKGMSLKSYNFTFRFAPVSEAESKMLRKIINKLKEYSLSKYVTNTAKNMLKYPMMVYPEFIVTDGEQIGTNGQKGALAKVYPFGFKYCVISSIGVDYAPNGSPAFFAKGKGETAFITLRIGLREIEMQTSEDYSEGESAGGYDNASSGSLGGDIASRLAGGGASDIFGGSITSSELPPPTSISTAQIEENNRNKIQEAFNAP